MQRPWFGPKRHGWGYTPVSWPGWLVTAAYAACVFVLAVTLAAAQPRLFWPLLILATAAFFLVIFLTRAR